MSTFQFPTPYQDYVFKSRYARFLPAEGRREEWPEAVIRYEGFMREQIEDRLGVDVHWRVWDELFYAVHDLEVMPSMRAMMTAGPALARDNTAGYNCSYIRVDHPLAFSEAMRVLLCGTGVGFGVEAEAVANLPEVPWLLPSDRVIIVQDSKEGWGDAFAELLSALWRGFVPSWDLSLVRPAGTRLKTFGGRASGPEPLDELFQHTVATFRVARGRKLMPIECHDLMCKIGDVVVVGGVRRSAMISLSDLDDERLRHAKSGMWWETFPYRRLANNSGVHEGRPDPDIFMREWLALYQSKSGERGIFNRAAAQKQAQAIGRAADIPFGTNPCAEIVLRPQQFCNLTEVVARPADNLAHLERKVRLATILGTFQSTLTYFPYLREEWQRNTEEERLLGVSITGIMDNALTSGRDFDHPDDHRALLARLRDVARETNAAWADALGIPRSAAITCVKPSGTVSQLVDSASGIHPRYAKYYRRSVRQDNKDPLTEYLKEAGIPWEPCVMSPHTTTVFYFPQKSPEGALTTEDLGAVRHLEIWNNYRQAWCDHNPSCTINVREDEWLDVGAWVYRHFETIGGLSFLPWSDHVYQQAPYQTLSEAEYNEDRSRTPSRIDWQNFREDNDNTTASQELACTGGACEIVGST